MRLPPKPESEDGSSSGVDAAILAAHRGKEEQVGSAQGQACRAGATEGSDEDAKN